MEINKDWRNKLNELPDWASNAITKLDPSYDYIAYRLSENVDNFSLECIAEIEKKLNGIRDSNSEYHFNALHQRTAFFLMAIRFADYFRPNSEETNGRIPQSLQRKLNPSAIDDLEVQAASRIQIGDLARNIALQLQTHHRVTQRLGVNFLFKSGHQGRTISYANALDELAELAKKPSQSLKPAEIELGISSRKSDLHFYHAFINWLSENLEQYGGFIPNNFHLTDRCWASLFSCLTYKDIDEKSIQMSRKRAVTHQEKAFQKTPQFDFNKLFESWDRK